MGVDRWTVTQAKAELNEVIERARSFGPQTITRNGRAAAMVVAAEVSGWHGSGNSTHWNPIHSLRCAAL